ncbi:MAG: hypothetical protein DRJ03_22905, partial [Chloroflexi bacterium]
MDKFLRALYKGPISVDEALKRFGSEVIERAKDKGWVREKKGEFRLTDAGREFLERRIFGPQEIAKEVAEEIRRCLRPEDAEVKLVVNWAEDKESGTRVPLGEVQVVFKNPEKVREFAEAEIEFRRKLPKGFTLRTMHDAYIRVNSYWEFGRVDTGYFEVPGLVISIDSEILQTELGRVRHLILTEPEDLYQNDGREPLKIHCIVDENADKVQVGQKVILRGRKELEVSVVGRRPMRNVLLVEDLRKVDEIEDWVREYPEAYQKVKEMLNELIYINGATSSENIRWVERKFTIMSEEYAYKVPAILERLANLIGYGVALPRPALYILSLLLAPESGMSVLFVGDKGTGKNTAAKTIAKLMELGGKRCHIYRCERTSVANVFGGVFESGSRILSRGSIMLYDFVVFDEFHGAQKGLRAKMREYMGEHTVTIDLLAGNKPLQSMHYPAWQPCLILSNDKNGDNIEKIRLSGDSPVPVPFHEVIDRIESGPFIDRLTYYFLLTEGDILFWKDEVARRQERWKIVHKRNGEKEQIIRYPNEKALEAFIKTLFYEMSKVEPIIPEEVEKYLSKIADRRQRDALKLAAIAVAKLCLSEMVTKEMVDLAFVLRKWAERTFMRYYYFYVDLEGNILEMTEEEKRKLEEMYLSRTKEARDALLRELEAVYPSWVEQNAKLPSRSDLAKMLGRKPQELEGKIGLLYP